MVSERHKRAIVSHYALDLADAPDVDASLRTIRSRLEPRLGSDFRFYSPAVRLEWDADMEVPLAAVALQPCGNEEAYRHYQASIQKRVPVETILARVGAERERVAELLGDRREVAVWGVTGTERNRRSWNRLKAGDFPIFARNNEVFSSGVIVGKAQAPELAEYLWGVSDWELVYFLDDIRGQHLPYSDFNKLVGYDQAYRLRDFRILDSEKSRTVAQA